MANAAISASDGISRREFLYYIWGASIALITAQTTGFLVWSLIPRFREGEFGGRFLIPADTTPPTNTEPVNFAEGRFWLVNLDSSQPNELMYQMPDEEPIRGVAAIYKVCTHLGCIYSWTPANTRFECPCHGSKYRLDGRRIEAPAPRDLDRFKVEAIAEDKTTVLAEAEVNAEGFFDPLVLPGDTAFISVDTGNRMQGSTEQLICDFRGTCP